VGLLFYICFHEALLNFQNLGIILFSFRELLEGPLYYVLMITFACAYYWRTSPVAIAAICNLCAGDGAVI